MAKEVDTVEQSFEESLTHPQTSKMEHLQSSAGIASPRETVNCFSHLPGSDPCAEGDQKRMWTHPNSSDNTQACTVPGAIQETGSESTAGPSEETVISSSHIATSPSDPQHVQSFDRDAPYPSSQSFAELHPFPSPGEPEETADSTRGSSAPQQSPSGHHAAVETQASSANSAALTGDDGAVSAHPAEYSMPGHHGRILDESALQQAFRYSPAPGCRTDPSLDPTAGPQSSRSGDRKSADAYDIFSSEVPTFLQWVLPCIQAMLLQCCTTESIHPGQDDHPGTLKAPYSAGEVLDACCGLLDLAGVLSDIHKLWKQGRIDAIARDIFARGPIRAACAVLELHLANESHRARQMEEGTEPLPPNPLPYLNCYKSYCRYRNVYSSLPPISMFRELEQELYQNPRGGSRYRQLMVDIYERFLRGTMQQPVSGYPHDMNGPLAMPADAPGIEQPFFPPYGDGRYAAPHPFAHQRFAPHGYHQHSEYMPAFERAHPSGRRNMSQHRTPRKAARRTLSNQSRVPAGRDSSKVNMATAGRALSNSGSSPYLPPNPGGSSGAGAKPRLGEARRAALKTMISEAIRHDASLRDRVVGINKLKFATVDQLFMMAEIVGLGEHAAQMQDDFIQENQHPRRRLPMQEDSGSPEELGSAEIMDAMHEAMPQNASLPLHSQKSSEASPAQE